MFVASFCACRSHWLQWDTCLSKSRNMAVSYGQHFFFQQLFTFFCLTPRCFLPHTVFSEGLHSVFSIKAITHTHLFSVLHAVLLTRVRRYVCAVGKSSTDPVRISKALLLTVLLTRILLQCLPDEAGACRISITFDRRESPALAKRNKYRMLMAGNVHRAENNIFDKMLSVLCLSQTLAGCDSYFCPSLTWVMELSFLLQFLINVTAIKYLLIEESFK